jgi:hypothetical protein
MGRQEAGLATVLAFVLGEAGGSAQEQGAAVVTAEHAGVAADVEGDLVQQFATLREAHSPVADRVGDPRRPIGVEAHPIGRERGYTERFSHVVGGRGRAERSPVATVAEGAVSVDAEGAQPIAERLMTRVDPSGVIAAPLGNNSGSLTTATAPSGSTLTRGAGRNAAPPIRSKPKLPT